VPDTVNGRLPPNLQKVPNPGGECQASAPARRAGPYRKKPWIAIGLTSGVWGLGEFKLQVRRTWLRPKFHWCSFEPVVKPGSRSTEPIPGDGTADPD